MNDSPDNNAKLIAEAFHGEWSDGAPATFARLAAAHARRRRRLRRVAATAGACAIIAVISLIASRNRLVSERPIEPMLESRPVARSYEIISDDELLQRLRDRPLLVVKTQNGRNQFVLLEN
jgi:hypothetical protein